jgi:hypothetical protein
MTKDDELRQLILARRARFLAAAMCTSGVGIVGCDAGPTVCLSPLYYPESSSDAGSTGSYPTMATPEPSVCLSPTFVEEVSTATLPVVSSTSPDAGPDAGLDASSEPVITEMPVVPDGGSFDGSFDASSDASVEQSKPDAALDASSTVIEP